MGAGVIGLCLTKVYGQQLDLTIIAERFSPDTTSDSAGAIFIPGGNYVQGGSDSFAVKWEIRTFKYFNNTFGED